MPRSSVALLVLLLPSVVAAQSIIYVDDDAPLGGDGQAWNTAHRFLQDALGVASSGDEIRVAEGTYWPDRDELGNVSLNDRNASFQLRSGVSLLGGYAGIGAQNPELRDVAGQPSVLTGDVGVAGDDTDNSHHVVTGQDLDSSTRLDGFTITAGFSATLSGGGIELTGSNARIENCFIWRNTASNGGGVRLESTSAGTRFIRCRISGNRAIGEFGAGGGFFGSATLISCELSSNWAQRFGGGAFSSGVFYSCSLTDNVCEDADGGGGGLSGNATLIGCVIARNHLNGSGASGAGINGNASLVNCTVLSNSTSPNGFSTGIGVNGNAVISNSIVWDNRRTGGSPSERSQVNPDDDPAINHSCVQGWTGELGGEGNIGSDPRVHGELFTINPSSPCIDAGDNFAVPADSDDLDEDGRVDEPIPLDFLFRPRFVDSVNTPDTGNGPPPIVDMGAIEYILDCNGNGVDDFVEIADGFGTDCNGNFILDECEGPDSDSDGVINACDLCPNSPPGEPVGPDGCPADGVCCVGGFVCFDLLTSDSCGLIAGVFIDHQLECDEDPDGDGAIGCDDFCPRDSNKTQPGICGCGTPDEVDLDEDGILDCVDQCPESFGDIVDETGCPLIGACCFVVGVCVDETDPMDCGVVGGFYQGHHVACDAGCVVGGDGDYNYDGRVTLEDFAALGDCMTGPNGGPTQPRCQAFDVEPDDDVDLQDLATVFLGFTLVCTLLADCDDGDPCTSAACVNGSCVFTPIECPVGESCVNGECVATDPCEGVTCADCETCVDGVCEPLEGDAAAGETYYSSIEGGCSNCHGPDGLGAFGPSLIGAECGLIFPKLTDENINHVGGKRDITGQDAADLEAWLAP